MGIVQLLQWQRDGYPRYHQSRANLLIHIVAVPLFLAGTIVLVAAMIQGSLVCYLLRSGALSWRSGSRVKGTSWRPCRRNHSLARSISFRAFSLNSGLHFHGSFSLGAGLLP